MPKKFKNVSPLGALELPLVGRVIEAGEEFEVPDDLAVYLDGQQEVFEPVLSPAEIKAARDAEKAAAKIAAEQAEKAEPIEPDASHPASQTNSEGAN